MTKLISMNFNGFSTIAPRPTRWNVVRETKTTFTVAREQDGFEKRVWKKHMSDSTNGRGLDFFTEDEFWSRMSENWSARVRLTA